MQTLPPELERRAGGREGRGRFGPRGFSLLEVLFALIIFSTAAVMLSSSYLNVLTSYIVVGKGSGADQDIALARRQLMAQPDLKTAQDGDEFDAPAPDPGKPRTHIKWTADIQPTNTTDLFNVTLTCVVSTSDASTPTRTVTQAFSLLRPTWSVATDRTTLRQAAAQRIAVLQGKAQK